MPWEGLKRTWAGVLKKDKLFSRNITRYWLRVSLESNPELISTPAVELWNLGVELWNLAVEFSNMEFRMSNLVLIRT